MQLLATVLRIDFSFEIELNQLEEKSSFWAEDLSGKLQNIFSLQIDYASLEWLCLSFSALHWLQKIYVSGWELLEMAPQCTLHNAIHVLYDHALSGHGLLKGFFANLPIALCIASFLQWSAMFLMCCNAIFFVQMHNSGSVQCNAIYFFENSSFCK